MFSFRTAAFAGAAAIALAACVEDTSSGYVSADRRVDIVNQTGQTIYRFYGSRVSTSSWEEDILGSNVLPNGSRVNIDFDDGTGSCLFDMKAELIDGSEIIRSGVNVCTALAVTFY